MTVMMTAETKTVHSVQRYDGLYTRQRVGRGTRCGVQDDDALTSDEPIWPGGPDASPRSRNKRNT